MGLMPWDYRHSYAAYRWQTWTVRRFLRKSVERTGWRYAGYCSPYRDETVCWIQDTVRAMEMNK
jgi:hypothetical protein